jgi:hypothetical protein
MTTTLFARSAGKVQIHQIYFFATDMEAGALAHAITTVLVWIEFRRVIGFVLTV